MAAMKAALAYALALLGVIVGLATPAFADDAEINKQLEQSGSAYIEAFNKQDANGIAALYATGGMIVNQAGPHTDPVKYYEAAFKAGMNRLDVKVDQSWPLGSDAALAMGKYRVTGKDQGGAAIEAAGFWTATYVREGGKLKIRMLTAVQQPPPAK